MRWMIASAWSWPLAGAREAIDDGTLSQVLRCEDAGCGQTKPRRTVDPRTSRATRGGNMPVIVRAFPIREPVADLHAFAAALTTQRHADATAFYRQFGVSHESWHLQQTPSGDTWLLSVTVVDNPTEAAPRYAKSTAEFDRWFKDQVRHVSGIDPNLQPMGPPTTQVFAWSDPERPHSNLCA